MGVLRPDRAVSVGFWGRTSATLDWCEINYEETYYIAEFWNTISNLAMILPPLYSLFLGYKQNIERRFVLLYIFLMLVGIGSWWFHMTLLYEMQLMDELPMVWGTLIMVYCLMTVHYPKLDHNMALKCGLITYGTTLTTVYLWLKTPIIHQAGYGLLTTYALYLDIMIIRRLKNCDISLFYTAIALYYSGFMVWNIDNIFCDTLESVRQYSPILKPFTQFHALWHILAGYGSYVHLAFCIQVRSVATDRPIYFKWSGLILRPSRTKLSKN